MSLDKQEVLNYLRDEIASLKVSDWEAYAGISKDAIYAEALSEVMEKINSGALDAEPAGKPCEKCGGKGWIKDCMDWADVTCPSFEDCQTRGEPHECARELQLWCAACHGSGKVG